MLKRINLLFIVDLAGHEKYLKTTICGLNGYFIDYAMVTVGVDRGIIGMTKEHLALAIALKIPIFMVITKIDIAVEKKLNNITNRINKIFKLPIAGVKDIIEVDNDNIEELISNYSYNYNKVPVFKISNVTGENVNNLRKFIKSLKPNVQFGKSNEDKSSFIIDDRFKLKGARSCCIRYCKRRHI